MRVPEAVCPCCGQSMPRDYLFVGTDFRLEINGIKRAILDAVTAAGPNGIHAERLFTAIYQGGGPITGLRCMATNIKHLNNRLKPFGKKVYAGNGSRFYRLLDLK